MKYLILTLLIVFLTGCSTLEATPEPEVVTQYVTKTEYVEVEDTEQIDKLTNELNLTNEELAKYQELVLNLNDILSNVYYGYASNSNYESDGFTAFSMEYKGKYYVITAGHCVHYISPDEDTKVYTNFRFKANFSDEWIYPELLGYDTEWRNRKDYAILFSEKVDSGLKVGENYGQRFVLGNTDNNLNIIRDVDTNGLDGESGSPIINIRGEAVAIDTGVLNPLDVVLQAIDDLE